jgi:ribosomal protein L12E/L44/L45/RPP1/RPP2
MSLKYLAAYALVQLSGSKPTKDAVKAVLKAGGVTVDEARVNELFGNFEGKDFDNLVKDGLKKVSAGGAAAGAAPAAAAPAKGKEAPAAPAKAKEAPKPKEEEDDGAMLDLFG